MKSTPYQIGYRFERRVKKHFQKQGYEVIRQSKSSFPDLWVLSPDKKPFAVECKVAKYISETEKMLARVLIAKGYEFKVAYRVKRKLLFWDGNIHENKKEGTNKKKIQKKN